MSNGSIKLFGVGDGWPCADRNHSSFLYRFGDVSILIDCGENLSRNFKASGLSYNLIDRIFISHMHADHIGGFFMLMQGFWLEQRRKELPVTMPEEGIQPVKDMLHAGMLFAELLNFKMKFEKLRESKSVLTKNVKVTPYRSTHLEQLRKSFQGKYPQAFEAFCFLIERGNLRIGHSADLGCPEDLAPLLKKPLDLLVCELAHFQAEDLFLYLHGKDIKRIVFIHVGRPYWEDLQKAKKLASKMLPDIPFAFAKDGQEIRF
jgi:ribonuclease BN (tRNA processing enzyme)